jgi:AcrR family transcriptional regulator
MALRLPAIERKEQVLDVALTVFAVKGFHDTSMNDIAEAAGVTKPVVYQHYESKRALFLAIIDHVGDRMIDVLTAATSGLTDGHDQVEAGMVAFFKWVERDKNAFKFLFDSGTQNDEEFTVAIRKVLDRSAEAIAPLIAIDLDPIHVRTLAHGVAGVSEGVARFLINNNISFNGEQIGKQIANLLWAGLRGVDSE